MGQFIDKIGIEVEGGYDPEWDAPRHFGAFQRTGDGSLRSKHGDSDKYEYVSEPIKFPDGMDDLEADLRRLYENIIDINMSMGLHIHFSINKEGWLHRLCSERFADFMWARIEMSDLFDNNHRLRDRMAMSDYTDVENPHPGRTNYSEKNNRKDIDNALHNNRRGARYRCVNYSAIEKQKTIEIRMFPAMATPDQVIEAVQIVAETVNAFYMQKRYRDGIKGELSLNKDDLKQKNIQLDNDEFNVEQKEYDLSGEPTNV